MRDQRLLFLNNQGLDQSGGGVTILRHLVRHLARTNRVTVCAESRADDPELDELGVEQVVLPVAPPPGSFRWRFEPFLRARHWGRAVPPLVEAADALVVLDCHFAWVAAGLEAGRRVYLSLSAIARQEAFGSPPGGRRLRCWQYARLERDAIADADATVVASRTHAQELRRYVRPPAFEPVVLHPVFPLPDEPPRGERAEGEPVHVLTLGRLVPSKGVGLVPEVAARLRDLACEFTLVGDGPERASVADRARELDVKERVTLAGGRRDPSAFLRRADVLFHPSRYESFGMAVVEAMQRGVPPVCGAPGPRTVTAAAELVTDGVSGRLVDLDDVDALAAALRELVEDRARREALGAGARRAAGELERVDYVRAFENVLEGATA